MHWPASDNTLPVQSMKRPHQCFLLHDHISLDGVPKFWTPTVNSDDPVQLELIHVSCFRHDALPGLSATEGAQQDAGTPSQKIRVSAHVHATVHKHSRLWRPVRCFIIIISLSSPELQEFPSWRNLKVFPQKTSKPLKTAPFTREITVVRNTGRTQCEARILDAGRGEDEMKKRSWRAHSGAVLLLRVSYWSVTVISLLVFLGWAYSLFTIAVTRDEDL